MQSSLLLFLVVVGILLAVPSPAKGVGGLKPIDVSDEGVVRAAHFAVAEIDKKSNSLFASKLTDIKSAQKQVVRGFNYYLTIEMTQTKCKRNNGPVEDLDSCDTDNSVKQLCEVTVNEFIGASKLLKKSCTKGKK